MAIDDNLDFRDQVKKAEFEKLAQNSRSLAANLSAASKESNNFIQRLILNNKAISAQQKSISQQLIADRAQLRLNTERSRLLQDDNNRLKRLIQQKKAEAELIATTGRDSRGRFRGAADIDRLSTEANTLTSQYQGQVLTQRSLMAESEGLEQSMSQSGKELKGLKMQGIAMAAQEISKVIKQFADAMAQLVNLIYKTQQDLTVQMGTATDVLFDAQMNVIQSYMPFSGGPILNRDEIVNAFSSFKKEFGTILSSEEATRIAAESKRLGISSDTYVKARRAFLGTGNAETVRMQAMAEFQKQGLSAGAALQYAAENADLLAIAGDKYADSLFKAAAESKKIGVNLRDIEKFANSLVGDFEGSLENFAELSALGVEMDFNKLAEAAATGTPEEMQAVLKEQLSLSGITGEELQRNRQLRLSLSQTTGLDDASILRLAGVVQQPTEQTVEEKQVTLLSSISENIAKLTRIFAVAAGIIGGGLAGFAASGGNPFGAIVGAITGGYAATKFATGGFVRGAGTSTSDSIPAMLSDGEYVLNAGAVRSLGVDTLNSLNSMKPDGISDDDDTMYLKRGGPVKKKRKAKLDKPTEPQPEQFTLLGKTYNRINKDIPTWAEKALILSISAAGRVASAFSQDPKADIFKQAVLDRRTKPFTENDFSAEMLDSLAMLYATLPKPKNAIRDYNSYKNAKQMLSGFGNVAKNINEWELIIGRANISKSKTGVKFSDVYDFNDYESSKWLSSKGRSKDEGILTKWGLDVAGNRKIGISNIMSWLGRRALPGDVGGVPVEVQLNNDQLKVAKSQLKSVGLPKKHAGGLIGGQGEVPTMLEAGEFVVSAKATQAYGSDMLGKINTGAYAQEQPVVNNNVKVDTGRLEAKMDNLVSAIRSMKVEMNGYEVGHVSFNEARTPLRVR